MEFTYQLAIVGGTFDHFHKGHKKLLDTSFEKAKQVIVGISKPPLYEHKILASAIESYETREQSVREYLQSKGWLDRATIIPITDIFGNSLQVPEIEAIVVSNENLPAVEIINKKRQEIGFNQLHIEIVPDVFATDGTMITSERIRRGEIDREGFVYSTLFTDKKQLVLPDSLRSTLHEPLGKIVPETKNVVSSLSNNAFVIAVGDIVAAKLSENNYTPAIRIIDQMNRRQKIVEVLFNKGVRADNQHGTIQTNAVVLMQSMIKKYVDTKEPQTLIIDGEEDLLALPAIMFAPLDSIVLYGQYGKGVIVNKVTESLKAKVRSLLEKFQ